jgi:hypothetical protein
MNPELQIQFPSWQIPLPEQLLSHFLFSQASPKNEAKHLHKPFDLSQIPLLEQFNLHFFSEQSFPSNSLLHSQSPFDKHTPLLEQLFGHSCLSQDSPLKPSRQTH